MLVINQLFGRKVNYRELTKVANKALKVVGKNPRQTDISLAIVDDKTIEKFNKLYRQKRGPTDVLSFNYSNKQGGVNGEIVISYEQARGQAREYKHSLLAEIKILLVHGFLHLVGFDHQTKKEKALMWEKECEILGKSLCARM